MTIGWPIRQIFSLNQSNVLLMFLIRKIHFIWWNVNMLLRHLGWTQNIYRPLYSATWPCFHKKVQKSFRHNGGERHGPTRRARTKMLQMLLIPHTLSLWCYQFGNYCSNIIVTMTQLHSGHARGLSQNTADSYSRYRQARSLRVYRRLTRSVWKNKRDL
jgi:hypothetical protein